MRNKKVLLRERKRHTARRVVSTPSVVLPGYNPPGGGTQTSVLPPGGGTQVRVPPGGVYPDLGTPRGGEVRSGTPPGGVPDRTPPPPPPVDRQTPVKTVPSRRTTYAGGKKSQYTRVVFVRQYVKYNGFRYTLATQDLSVLPQTITNYKLLSILSVTVQNKTAGIHLKQQIETLNYTEYLLKSTFLDTNMHWTPNCRIVGKAYCSSKNGYWKTS